MAHEDDTDARALEAARVAMCEDGRRLRQRLCKLDHSIYAAWLEHLDKSPERVRHAHRPSSPSQSRICDAAPANPEGDGA